MDGSESSQVFDSFVAGPYEVDSSTIEAFGCRAIFEALEASKWIARHRLPLYGRFDMFATAQFLGVPFSYDSNQEAHGHTTGVPGADDENKPLAIFVRPDGNNELVTFGHEVGHIFMGLVAQSNYGQHNRELEAFCELFGREMALPSCELMSITVANESVIMGLLETYGTDLDTTLTRLVELGKLPRKILVLTTVPLEYGGMHAGRVVEVVFCFDCNEHEYKSCTPGQKEQLARFDLSTREDAYNLTACGNEKRWVYEEERTDRLIGESFWDDSDESFQERDIL